MTQAQLNAVLTNLTAKATFQAILDELAEIAAQNASEVEPIDTDQAKRWDTASGRIAVCATRVAV